MTIKTPTTILLVEDDSNARDVYALVLQMEGYFVVGAENGQHALNLMEAQKIDAILTDLLMPVMDGLDFATALKSDPRFYSIPVVLLSGRDLKDECRDIDVFSALLKKPCSADDLTSTLASVLAQTYP